MTELAPQWGNLGFDGQSISRSAGQMPGPAGLRPGLGILPQVKIVQLGTVSGASTVTFATVRARVDNPSSRFTFSIAIAFEPISPGVAPLAGATPTNYTIRAMRPGDSGRREVFLHEVNPATDCPHLYEGVSAVRQFEVAVDLRVPVNAGGAAIPGTWLLIAEWEPAIDVCADDMFTTYSRCGAQLTTAQGAL